jgi:hypothetical protein
LDSGRGSIALSATGDDIYKRISSLGKEIVLPKGMIKLSKIFAFSATTLFMLRPALMGGR